MNTQNSIFWLVTKTWVKVEPTETEEAVAFSSKIGSEEAQYE